MTLFRHFGACFCHSGAARRAEPGIQMQVRSLFLDSGFAPPARPGMTALAGHAGAAA